MIEPIHPEVLKIIYTENLYLVSESDALHPTNLVQEKNQVTEPETLPYTFEHQTIIVTKKEIAVEEKYFLQKVLAAVKVDINETHILSLHNFNFSTIPTSKKHSLLLFEIEAIEIGIKDTLIPKYEVKQVGNTQVLCLDSLLKISSDETKKRALWMNLQRMYL